LVRQLVDRPAVPAMVPAYARLCLPYVAATALLTGSVEVGDFDADALQDNARLTLAARIRVRGDANPSLSALAPQRVELRLRDGSQHAIDLPAVLGAPGRPLSEQSHLAKFRRAAASGLRPLSAPRVEALIALVDRLETLNDVRQLVDALIPD
jgi:2-methylcitrate dehydratase PrpD